MWTETMNVTRIPGQLAVWVGEVRVPLIPEARLWLSAGRYGDVHWSTQRETVPAPGVSVIAVLTTDARECIGFNYLA
jgi:hypothetical protein